MSDVSWLRVNVMFLMSAPFAAIAVVWMAMRIARVVAQSSPGRIVAGAIREAQRR